MVIAAILGVEVDRVLRVGRRLCAAAGRGGKPSDERDEVHMIRP